MAKLRIRGGRRLSGRIVVEGNKNAALPLIAACLLTDQECVLSNVPRIRDVDVLLELMKGLGATVHGAGTSTIRIRCTETALLAAAGAKGRTEIRHAAMEPHVVELCRFLRALGVAIEGEGTPTIR